jgi:uncharacterized protein (TIGR03545 family)
MARLRLFRWRAIVPLLLFVGLLVVGWLLLLDRIVERGIEAVGTHIVGARVDLAEADVRLADGAVVLRGLEVTNPDRPMTNLFEADEIVADIRTLPLLEQKVAIDTVAVRGLRFGTEREASGAITDPSPASGRVAREVTTWADAVRFPEFSLEGLGQAVNVGAVAPESLRTVSEAEGLIAQSAAVRERWDRTLAALDAERVIDSARALVEQLQQADVRALGPLGVTRLAGSTRETIGHLGEFTERVQSLDDAARSDFAGLQQDLGRLAAARQADYAYARSLLRLPSMDAPDISPALFGEAAVGWIKPVLYWLQLAEQYLPPGLDPRRYSASGRARSAGTTVTFPREGGQPRFLLEHAEASVELGGSGLEAGAYRAVVRGLTSSPALYGKPLEFLLRRGEADVGPADIRVAALLDHVAAPVHDSIEVSAGGIELGSLDLPSVGARLVPGRGAAALSLDRRGGELAGEWSWRSAAVTWERLGAESGAGQSGGARPPIGSREWADEFLWRTVSGIRNVEVAVRFSGELTGPELAVRSNVGDVIALSLRRELGREIQRAELEVRNQVDALVGPGVTRARSSVAGLESMLREDIGVPLDALIRARADLEQEIQRLTRRLPGGIRIPGGR